MISWYFAEPVTVNSNFVAYLTNTKKEGELVQLYVIYVLLMLTALNISVTYICIHVYLKMKHSKAIDIAEKTQGTMKVSLISLRHLAAGFHCCLIVGVYNFCIIKRNAYQNLQSVPPGSIVVNFMTVLISMHFISTKREITNFLKRRLSIPLSDIPLPSNPPNNESQNIKNKRRIAWN